MSSSLALSSDRPSYFRLISLSQSLVSLLRSYGILPLELKKKGPASSNFEVELLPSVYWNVTLLFGLLILLERVDESPVLTNCPVCMFMKF